ncbi:DUF6443 domain-containing protein [Chryseobacterium polytrichastri]|uniref:RHS repeat-associated core domain-containing protein n=1 Tax=Chryseobacterium polytrichastri TaxID=1302687 RepID=A0A1M6R404_9FLAO|nr:DUF6443 domain-containing protein [Chryseobacterium polytrichastri]SHK27058.1 RHS repeat-associated core domain-containing protein [Chryseobacterium polytrichastri]
MKKILILIWGLLLGSTLHAQNLPTTENYIETRTYLDSVTISSSTAKQIHTVQYFDGLGRPKQVVNVKASPLGRDVVSHIEYDGFGRQTKDFLPIPQSQTLNGAIAPTPLANATSVYGLEKIYAEKILENSPLDRIQQQIQVGTDWASKPVKFEYDTNNNGDYVRKYETTTTWDPVGKMMLTSVQLLQYFPIAQLYKNTIIDEDGNRTIEFKNGKGQTLLVRKVINPTENADTYYVYNEYDVLAYVIPPLASAPTVEPATVENLYYQYRYDGRKRLVEKKVPGKGWEYMLYDKQDRLVATQDTALKQKGQWIYTKYDQFGRVAITGIGTGSERITEQNMVDGLGSNNVNRLSTPLFERQGMDVYYGNQDSTYPNSTKWITLLSLNYYDTYPNYSFNPSFPTSIFGPTLTDNPTATGKSTKGLSVMSLVKNIEDDNWTKNYSYYDTRGRVVGTYSINHLGGFTETKSELDFAGAPKQNITRHKRVNTDTEKVIIETFEYDHQNRLLVHKHKIDNNTEEILAQNKYNELSQLESKKVGGINISTPLQTIDYKYNIHGWMTKINDPVNLNGKLFGYELKYHNPVNTTFAMAKYNGNIAEVDWKTSNDDVLKRYSYNYDKLNRLNFGHYSEPNSTVPLEDHFGESIEYDLNGNITRLYRNAKNITNGMAMQIDNLTYSYAGNRLLNVTDASQNYLGYVGGGNTIGYDLNGNMTSHVDKGITSIQYNFLNLPSTLIKNNNKSPFGGAISHLYGADGRKLKKAYSYYKRDWQGNTNLALTTTEYLDSFQYVLESNGFGCIDCPPPSPNLQFVPTSEGYFDFVKNKYIYNYTDHLGNIRLSYFNNGNSIEVLEENNYYPFGLKHEGVNVLTGNTAYQYKYNGKEYQQEIGMTDFGARMYMNDLGRWGVIDPLSELQFAYSPYSYVYGNPIRFNDPTGMIGEDPDPKKIYGPKGGHPIEEVVITGVSKAKQMDRSLSFMGIQSLNSFHASEDRFAAGIRGSKAALATEKFEKNFAFAIGTFGMGGTNLFASAAWATFDTYMSYQDEETQDAVGTIQLMAIIAQVSHGNASGVNKLINIGKQGKHIIGHNNYIIGKSILKEDAQLLLDAFHSGNIKSSRVINEAKVSVDFGKVIGDFVQDGVPTPTSVGTVINSKTGVHIVPANPIQY